jgi:sulfite reductase alpha subunit-like flavoprotein
VRYQARLKALFPGLQAALTQRLGDTAKMQKVAEFAREKAAVTQYEVALQALDALEKLLQAARQTSTAQTIEPGAPLTPIWTAAKERMDEQLSALQLAMRRFGDPGLDEIATKMADSLANYRSTLIAALMSYDRATEATREPLRQRASDVVRSYRERLATDTDVAAADDNPFKLKLDMRSTLDGALDRIAAALQQAGAQAQRAAAS